MVAAATMAIAGCAGPAMAPRAGAAASPVDVSGCVPSSSSVTWSGTRSRRQVTGVVLFDSSGRELDSRGWSLEPAVTGAGVPASWLKGLLSSLGRQVGTDLGTAAAGADLAALRPGSDSSFRSSRQVGYSAVSRVSGDFAVSCPDGTVRGTAVSWSGSEGGVVPCELITAARSSEFSPLAPLCDPSTDLVALGSPILLGEGSGGVLEPDIIGVN